MIFLNKRESEAKAFILTFLDEFLINLSSTGILDTFCSFVVLVAKSFFPLDNIARQLFLDVVTFYSVDDVSGLRCDANNKSTVFFRIFAR